MSLLILNGGPSDPVDQDLNYSWQIDGDISLALPYSWSVYEDVDKPLDYSWIIDVFVEGVLNYSWSIWKNLDKALSYSWRVMGFFLSSKIMFNFRSDIRKKKFRRAPPKREDFD